MIYSSFFYLFKIKYYICSILPKIFLLKKNNTYRCLISIIYIGVFFVSVSNLSSQTYGLKFKGIDESLDNRTKLNLTPKSYLTFEEEFEISFDYKTTRINPNNNIGLFGYIFRIINRDNYNVDLISSINEGDNTLFLNIVMGKSDSIVQAIYPETAINNWIKLKVKFDLLEDRLIFYTPDSFFVLENIGFNTKDEFKIIFGANDYNQFKTSDVPTMQIRDIKISEQGKLKYHWPLDETDENVAVAIDRIKKQKAEVKNPSWLNRKHKIWEPKFENEINGQMMIAADNENGKIFLVGMDELLIYSVDNNYTTKVIYKNKPVFIIPDYKAIYNSLDKKIYCYMVDEGPSFVLDINSGVWERLFTSTNIPTRFRHHNRYFDPSDNSIYLFGGYGRHKYNNEIRKINLNENTLTDLPTDPSVFYPKYLAGLGALNDTIYILGGYGSRSGNQLINPHSYYDLIGYSIKDSTLFKKFEIPHIIEDMCVANSMWIDGETRDYFALVFEKSKFNGHLQLIRGELDSPNVELVGNKIPFQFLDVRSSAGLLFMAKQKKLIAYSTYVTDSATTKTRIHTINYPPNAILEKVEDSRESKKESYLFATVGVIIIIVLIYLFFPKERAKNIIKNRSVDKDIDKSLLVNPSDILINKTDYQLIFFGGFQAINKNLEDITVHFTPLLKELFLLIWLHTFKNNKGISTEKLTEILWYDKSEKSAQNNRAVNLAKLRTLLAELGGFKLSKKTGYWKAIYNESDVKTDYVDFLNLTTSKTNLTKQKINQLIEITKKGPFLRNVQYPWLDEFKADVSEITIDTLIYFANLCHIEEDADFIIHLADSIFIFDSTNEDAMIFKCKALSLAGKHSHAKATYDKFCKEFIEMYGQEYEEPFANILKNDN